jgi:quinol monooxygenase YgiN
MLIRIVRMHFTAAGTGEFLKIFKDHQEAIRNFPGCSHLLLLRDLKDDICYTTLSHWNDPGDLEAYRKSELFGSVWRRVKPLFARQPEAYSLIPSDVHLQEAPLSNKVR